MTNPNPRDNTTSSNGSKIILIGVFHCSFLLFFATIYPKWKTKELSLQMFWQTCYL